MKRFLCLILSLALCMSFTTSAFADDFPPISNDDEVHMQRNQATENNNITVYYEMVGEDVAECIYFSDEDINIVRTISPDNTMTVEMAEDGITHTYSIIGDYEMFKGMYLMQENPAFCNNDIVGSQYIHQYVGSPGSVTMYRESIRKCGTASALAAFILERCGFIPAASAALLASYILGEVAASEDCYKVIITSTTYQVLFAADRSYYIHCYHEMIKYYKENASSPYKTERDYYQAIGG